MKTGTRKKTTDKLLKAAMLLCVAYTLLNLAGVVYSRIPPYAVGQCISDNSPLSKIKVSANNIAQGFSVLDIDFLGQKQQVAASFMQLRDSRIKAVDCE